MGKEATPFLPSILPFLTFLSIFFSLPPSHLLHLLKLCHAVLRRVYISIRM